MPSCALRYCKSRYGKTSGPNFALFSFPNVDTEEREKWIKFVQIDRSEENWIPSSSSKLCSKHFKREDIYFGKTGRSILIKGSVPYITSESDEISPEASGLTTPTDVYVSDSESICDTPRKIGLKARVHKLQQQKLRHQIKIKKLQQQNRYLKRKILNLKEFVNHLKKKFGIKRWPTDLKLKKKLKSAL